MVQKGDLIVNKLLAWMGAIGVSNYDGVTSPAYDIGCSAPKNSARSLLLRLFVSLRNIVFRVSSVFPRHHGYEIEALF